MQYLSRNLQTRDQFMINKRARSRKILPVPKLTVHKNEKQEFQDSKFEKMFGEGVKVRKNIGNIIHILQQMPSSEYKVLKNMKSKLNMDLNESDAYDTCYKTHNRTVSNRPLTNLRKKSELTINHSQPRNTQIQRLLKKLSKNKMKSNCGFLMGIEDFADPNVSFYRRKHSDHENLSESLSCKLATYNNSNLLSKYTVRKALIKHPNQSNPSKNKWKKQGYQSRYDQSRRIKTYAEEELTGWQINMESKQVNSINFCSLQPFQL